mmetsp:Transcript_102658/g.162234  ORF Transcript_102658/g.162234 Transcript_102658/m.162234 type:complete len:219 (+) Transcript_102658:559-1215(+)
MDVKRLLRLFCRSARSSPLSELALVEPVSDVSDCALRNFGLPKLLCAGVGGGATISSSPSHMASELAWGSCDEVTIRSTCSSSSPLLVAIIRKAARKLSKSIYFWSNGTALEYVNMQSRRGNALSIMQDLLQSRQKDLLSIPSAELLQKEAKHCSKDIKFPCASALAGTASCTSFKLDMQEDEIVSPEDCLVDLCGKSSDAIDWTCFGKLMKGQLEGL